MASAFDPNPNSRCNRVPLSSEAADLQTLVAAEENVLNALTQSIGRALSTCTYAESRVFTVKKELEAALSALSAARETVATLEAARDPIVKSIVNKKALLHPIRRLPSELLEAIFILRVEEDEYTRRSASDLDGEWGPCDGPIILSGVCSSWRKIVQAQPNLWKYCNITISRMDVAFAANPTENKWIDKIAHWNRLSSQIPLAVAVGGIGSASDPDGLTATPMMKHLFQQCGGRIERLHLLFVGVGALGCVLGRTVTSNLPNILHLHIHIHESVHPNTALIPFGAFSKSKKLETLCLRNIWWDKDLSLPNLTVFDVYNPAWAISPQQLFNAISNCPQLRQMPIEFEYQPSEVPVSDRLSLEHLKELQTTCEYISRAGGTLIAGMFAPSLEKLQLYGCGDVDVVAQFIKLVTPKLVHLHLGLTPNGEAEFNLLTLLLAAPTLQELEIDSLPVPGALFDALVYKDGSPCVVPLLTVIILKESLISEPDALLRFVTSRTKPALKADSGPKQLEDVILVGEHNVGAWHQAQIESLLDGSEDPIAGAAEPVDKEAAAATAQSPDSLVHIDPLY